MQSVLRRGVFHIVALRGLYDRRDFRGVVCRIDVPADAKPFRRHALVDGVVVGCMHMVYRVVDCLCVDRHRQASRDVVPVWRRSPLDTRHRDFHRVFQSDRSNRMDQPWLSCHLVPATALGQFRSSSRQRSHRHRHPISVFYRSDLLHCGDRFVFPLSAQVVLWPRFLPVSCVTCLRTCGLCKRVCFLKRHNTRHA